MVISWLADDLRYAARLLRRTPLFTAATVLTFAVAIGANTTLFTLVNSVLLRQLPFASPDRLVWVWLARSDGARTPFSIDEFADYRRDATTLDGLAAFAAVGVNLTGDGVPERIAGTRVSANFFDVLGAHTAIGRGIALGDDERGGRVVVLTDRLWRRCFGADPSIVGRAIALNGAAFTVIGVTPPDFIFPIKDAELAVPFIEADVRRTERTVNFLRFVARLRPGVTIAQATDDLSRLARRLQQLRPLTNARDGAVAVVPLHEEIVGDLGPTLRFLLLAVGLLLLLACFNLANLWVSRIAGRQRELAVRAALGASRARIAAQLLTESVLPALAGGAAGVGLSILATRLIIRLSPITFPRGDQVQLDGRVLLFTAGVSLLAGVLVGVGPVLLGMPCAGAGWMTGDAVRGSSEGRTQQRLRRLLVGAEIALSLVLLSSMAVLTQSFVRLEHVSPGFRADHALSVRLSLPRAQYPDRESVLKLQRALGARLRTISSIRQFGAVSLMPFSGGRASIDFLIEGRPMRVEDVPTAQYRVATPGYFGAIGIPLLAGRDFTDADRPVGRGVAIVNRTMAERFWPNASAVGQFIRRDEERQRELLEIVGVVEDVKHFDLSAPPTMDLYIPFAQIPEESVVWVTNNQFWVARTANDPLANAKALTDAVRAVDPDVPAAAVRSLEEIVDGSLGTRRFNLWVIHLFGYAALLLAATGIYSVTACAVTRRTREFGIRQALGAGPRDLLGLLMRAVATPVALGLALGALGSTAVHRLIATLLYHSTNEASTLAGVAAALAAIALAAIYVPARRGIHLDPAVALRVE